MKKYLLLVFLVLTVLNPVIISVTATDNPRDVIFHANMKNGSYHTWKLALFPVEGASSPKLGDISLKDGDLLKIQFTANPPTDWTTYSNGDVSAYNDFYLNDQKLVYNDIKSSLAMYMLFYLNPITTTFENGTTQSLKDQLIHMDTNLGDSFNMTDMPADWSQAEIFMMVPFGSLGNQVYEAQIDLNVGILQGNHILIPNNFEMMWTYHNGGTTSAPGFELLSMSLAFITIAIFLKRRHN